MTTCGGIGLGTFYFSSVVPWDWTSPQNGDLWRDGSKTLFDPCPTGWRVPKGGVGSLSPWSAFGADPYAAPFFYYINGVRQTTDGIPVFVMHPNNGRRYDRENGDPTAWYPAPGNRNAGYNGLFGGLASVGHQGFSWSSSISSTNGLNLGFDYHWLHPSGANGRAFGFPVRCVRE